MNTILAILGTSGPKQRLFTTVSKRVGAEVEEPGLECVCMCVSVYVCVHVCVQGGGGHPLLENHVTFSLCADQTRYTASNPPSKSHYACYSILS